MNNKKKFVHKIKNNFKNYKNKINIQLKIKRVIMIKLFLNCNNYTITANAQSNIARCVFLLRCGRDSNPRIAVLQTAPLDHLGTAPYSQHIITD